MMSFWSTLMGYLVSGHIFDGTLPFSCTKIQKKILAGLTSGECSLCQKKLYWSTLSSRSTFAVVVTLSVQYQVLDNFPTTIQQQYSTRNSARQKKRRCYSFSCKVKKE